MKELEIEEDEFLQQYHLKRLMEMKKEQETRLAMSRYIQRVYYFQYYCKLVGSEPSKFLTIIIHMSSTVQAPKN